MVALSLESPSERGAVWDVWPQVKSYPLPTVNGGFCVCKFQQESAFSVFISGAAVTAGVSP